MTSRIRVPIWGLNKSVMIPSDATKGAQLGIDLIMPDGSIATAAKLAAYIGVTPTAPNASPNITTTNVFWSRILGIPQNILQPPFSDSEGPPGADGDAIPGPRGLQGVPGIGVPGDDGYIGSDGDQGPPGAAGAASTVPGPQGPPGAPIPADDGRDGYDGDPVPGPQGPQGVQGLAGIAGIAGPPGDDGFIGMDGDHIPGPPGIGISIIGPPGDDGAPGADADTSTLPLAPPSALVGLVAITGNATTTMRSDAAPAFNLNMRAVIDTYTYSMAGGF